MYSTQCEATAALDQEIYRVHHILDSLYRTRKSYLQNMNSVHDPIVSRLPVEVISHIFTFFIPQTVHQSYGPVLTLDEDEELRTTPFSLGAVCKTWRSIAWSTTLLWTSMSLNIYKYYDGLDQVVREWLGRSGRWPLYIQLYASHGSGRFRRDTTNADEIYGAKLMDEINAYSDRWSHLDLNIPIQFMRRLHAKADGELGMLNTLKLANGLGHGYALENDDMIDFGAIPNLQSLCARGPDFHQIDYIRYESLTDVEASSLTVANCVCLLYIAPLITRLTVHKLVEGTANFKEDLMIRHDKLIWLEVNDCWSSKLASFLSFPSLVHLGAEIHKENGSDTESIQALLERSSCALKSMRLRLPSMSKKEGTDPEPAVEIIKSTIPPSIEHWNWFALSISPPPASTLMSSFATVLGSECPGSQSSETCVWISSCPTSRICGLEVPKSLGAAPLIYPVGSRSRPSVMLFMNLVFRGYVQK
ncbi:hypothetical protein BDN70DRAFT_133079 [Pholiota conissans]|uniref:F-box domain-containing protein n=1 Tax=Pholiota conissans TaxID=109636 RepID=A0A9P5YX23_9AGAR|nr:hypothetical protein BDN70DRAFT_133079 [Pholiota conissans]